MAKSISGIANAANIKERSQRSKDNSFHADKSETKHNIGTEGCKEDYEFRHPRHAAPKERRGQGLCTYSDKPAIPTPPLTAALSAKAPGRSLRE